MRLAWTARARTRLADIHDYIARDSKQRALAMVERILDCAETLLVAPRSGARLQAFTEDEARGLARPVSREAIHWLFGLSV